MGQNTKVLETSSKELLSLAVAEFVTSNQEVILMSALFSPVKDHEGYSFGNVTIVNTSFASKVSGAIERYQPNQKYIESQTDATFLGIYTKAGLISSSKFTLHGLRGGFEENYTQGKSESFDESAIILGGPIADTYEEYKTLLDKYSRFKDFFTHRPVQPTLDTTHYMFYATDEKLLQDFQNYGALRIQFKIKLGALNKFEQLVVLSDLLRSRSNSFDTKDESSELGYVSGLISQLDSSNPTKSTSSTPSAQASISTDPLA